MLYNGAKHEINEIGSKLLDYFQDNPNSEVGIEDLMAIFPNLTSNQIRNNMRTLSIKYSKLTKTGKHRSIKWKLWKQ